MKLKTKHFIISKAYKALEKVKITGGIKPVPSAEATSPATKKGWKVVFEDNFDGDVLNTEKWQYNYKDEALRRVAYWVDDAVFVQGR